MLIKRMNSSVWSKLRESPNSSKIKERKNKPVLAPPQIPLDSLACGTFHLKRVPFFFLMNRKSGPSWQLSKQGSAITSSSTLHHFISKSVRKSLRLFVTFIDLFLAFDSVDEKLMCYEWQMVWAQYRPSLPASRYFWASHNLQVISSQNEPG